MITGLVLATIAYITVELLYGVKRDKYILNNSPKGNFMIIDTEVRKDNNELLNYDQLDTFQLKLKEVCWIIIDPKGKEQKSKYYIHLDRDANLENMVNEFISDISSCSYLVAHNVKFDLDVINFFIFNRYLSHSLNLHTICTMELGIKYRYYHNHHGKKWPKLTELYTSIFKEEVMEKHRADYDARLCLKCFKHLYNDRTIKMSDIHLKEIAI